MSYLTKEKKQEIFTQVTGNASNTGSVESQIALLTERINSISKHQQANKKDYGTNRGLINLVGQRRSHLKYMQKHNLQGYRELIEKLGIRK